MRTRTSRLTIGALGLLALAGFGASARAADPEPPRADRIFSPGRSIVGEDSAEAIVLNPANVGYLPAPELRWTGVNCPDTQKVACGHAFDLASPLIWGLGTGFRLDYVQTPNGTPFPFSGSDYFWLTWALGLKISDTFALGFSLQGAYSRNPDLNGLFGVTAGATFRPNTHFAFAAVAQNFNGPEPQPLPPSGYPVLDASYVFGLDFRPTGTRALDVGLEVKYLQGDNIVLPRAIVSLDIPGLGRARGDIEVMNLPNDTTRAVVGTAGLEIYLNHASLGGGILAGNGLGPNQAVGEYLTASIAGYVNPGLPKLSRAIWIRIEDTPGTRDHVAFLRALWKLSEQEDVKAVTLVMRAEPTSSLAHAEELSDAVRLLRARGKKVLCSLESGGVDSLFVCANANRIVLNPGGTFRYSGLRYQYFYLAGLLEKLGIKGDFVRISPHKSAPEMYTNTQAGEVARADHEDLLRENETIFMKDVAQGRHLTLEQVRAAAEHGMTLPEEARDAKLVDQLAFDDEIERATQDMVGSPISYERYNPDVVAPAKFGTRQKVAILYIDGDIVDGRSQHIPLLDISLVGSYSVAETVKALRDDDDIRSVVLRIESPGGATTAADVMWRELSLLAKKKPLIVSMGTVAASGGYYIASPGRMIFAEPLTTTGSIGVFYGKADVSGLLGKIGVNVETYKSAPHADADSLFRGFTDEERARAQHTIERIYDTFLDRVTQGRHMTKEEVDAVARGRVWTGQEAFDRHLVDRLGGIREALEVARTLGGLPSDAPIEEVPKIQRTLFEELLSQVGINLHATALNLDGLPVQVRDLARAVAPLVVYPDETMLERMEWVPIEDTVGKDK
ncbi:MAG: signal peptide peptidase SppA [Polyangiaceae bacterium]